ncbi:MAG: glycosyltransferase family 39 protein [Cyanobacteria bacterium SZAS-4]|nr:glycosyltransferase family 39 protein [Cyanobacteria bacterium SZAS-4]
MSKNNRIELIGIGFLLVFICIGASLRFINLADKEFWHDESFTALVLSGRTTVELKDEISAKPCKFSDLTKYRTRTDRTDAASLLRVIGEDEPGHAPLFYYIVNAFCLAMGTTPFSMRLVCAIISLATLPVIYWLALETYKSKFTATLATTFASLSPILIYYAQEARDYSLGMFFMTLSSALLFYALRTSKRITWIAYASSLALGMYSWLFITIVIDGHILFVALTQKRSKEILLPFSLSIASAGLVFAPWLAFLSMHTANFKKAYDWIQPALTPGELLTVWLAIPYKALALFGFKTPKLATPLLVVTLLEFCSVALAAIPFKNARYLHLSIITIWLLVFAGQDLLTGGARSAVFRYQTVIIVSILMLLPTVFEALWKKNRLVKALAIVVLMLVFGIELLSDQYMLNCKIWPDKGINMRFTLPIAEHLNKEPAAYLVTEEQSINPTELLDLSYQTNPDCQLIFRSAAKPQPVPDDAQVLYLWNPSPELMSALKERFDITDEVDKFPYLKKATRK